MVVFSRFLMSALVALSALGAVHLPVAMAQTETARPTVAARELEAAIADRMSRVPEFEFIKAEANRMGVEVFLFGGTAAGFAHYVKWDLQREKGDTRYQKDRFDYDFSNIYRSTQDLDIVIDGTEAQARALGERLKAAYPNFQGSKDQWEVRLLRNDIGDKEAILGNPDFLNQHTDSNSTGLVLVNPKRKSDPVVRDVRDWEAPMPQFLRDVAEGKIHFYFSDLHETTNRFKQGKNPPIFSVVRFFTKAFQYELETRPDEVAVLQRLIDDFSPTTSRDTYVSQWLEKNGPKLFRHAVNIEFAWSTIEANGLRRKLIKFSGSTGTQDTLAWWMNRAPLRSSPIGEGNGKTAADLGLSVVAHETRDFLAFESITRSTRGEPNVLVSRESVAGESAAYGEGFYTQEGREGAAGTGLTVRFQIDPRARQGSDFRIAHGDKRYVIFHNKNALKVVFEDLNVDVMSYLKVVETIDASERGLLLKLRRRVGNRWASMDDAMKAEVLRFVERRVRSLKGYGDADPVLVEWFAMPAATEHPEILRSLIGSRVHAKRETLYLALENMPPSDAAFEALRFLAGLPSKEITLDFAAAFDVDTHRYAKAWQTDPRFAEIFLPHSRSVVDLVTKLPYLCAKVLDQSMALSLVRSVPNWIIPSFVENVLTAEPARSSPIREFVIEAIVARQKDNLIFRNFGTKAILDLALDRKDLVDKKLMSFATRNFKVEHVASLMTVLSKPQYQASSDYPSWVRAILSSRNAEAIQQLILIAPSSELRGIADWAGDQIGKARPGAKAPLQKILEQVSIRLPKGSVPDQAEVARTIVESSIRAFDAAETVSLARESLNALKKQGALDSAHVERWIDAHMTNVELVNAVATFALENGVLTDASRLKIIAYRNRLRLRGSDFAFHMTKSTAAMIALLKVSKPEDPQVTDLVAGLSRFEDFSDAFERNEHLRLLRDRVTKVEAFIAAAERELGTWTPIVHGDTVRIGSIPAEVTTADFVRLWDSFKASAARWTARDLDWRNASEWRSKILAPLRFFVLSPMMKDPAKRAELVEFTKEKTPQALTELKTFIDGASAPSPGSLLKAARKLDSDFEGVRRLLTTRDSIVGLDYRELSDVVSKVPSPVALTIFNWLTNTDRFDAERHRLISELGSSGRFPKTMGLVAYAYRVDALAHDPKFSTLLESDKPISEIGMEHIESVWASLAKEVNSEKKLSMTTTRRRALELTRSALSRLFAMAGRSFAVLSDRSRFGSSAAFVDELKANSARFAWLSFITNFAMTRDQQVEAYRLADSRTRSILAPLFFRVGRDSRVLDSAPVPLVTPFEKAQAEALSKMHEGQSFERVMADLKPAHAEIFSMYAPFLGSEPRARFEAAFGERHESKAPLSPVATRSAKPPVAIKRLTCELLFK